MKHYCIKCQTELKEEQLLCPKCGHCSFFEALESGEKNVMGVLSAQQIEANTQWTKYKCGKNGCTGHGFAAEDANAMEEVLFGNKVETVGRDNSKSGADRITNGQQIQTKYCQTAQSSVDAGFGEDGMYKYLRQVLEVPSDQYEEAVRIMQEKIAAGKVEGYTNPEDATKIVKKGSVTYRQAKNIAKAGNIDSLIFDAKTQAITALSSFGISFAINLSMMVLFRNKNELKVKEAMQIAFLSGLQNGTITLSSGILSSQLLRTQFGRNFAAYIQWGTKSGVNSIYQTQVGKKLIHGLAKTLFAKNLTGGAAKNAVAKFARTNVITNVCIFVVTSVPDTYYIIKGEISCPQFIKNLVVNSSGIAGATIGAWLGGAIGGPAGMVAGGLAGGAASGWASKKIADKISKDDSEKMSELIKVALMQLSNDYMIQTEEEFQRCIELITAERAIDTTLLRAMYSIGSDDDNDFLRVELAYKRLEYYFGVVIRERKNVRLLEYQPQLLDAINELGEQIEIPQ